MNSVRPGGGVVLALAIGVVGLPVALAARGESGAALDRRGIPQGLGWASGSAGSSTAGRLSGRAVPGPDSASPATSLGATLDSYHRLPARPSPQPPAAPEPATEVTEAVEQPELYSYDSEGRRDPFVNLLARGTELPSDRERPDGLVGLSINEVALRGVVLNGGAYLAVLEAPDNRTYIVRPEDRLFDGAVREITADGIVFLQEVSDPLSIVTEREVRKGLRDAEEGR